MRFADPVGRARELQRLHGAALGGDDVAGEFRPVIWESWRRSLEARVDPDGSEPAALVDAELRERQREHPLATMLPMLRETLLGAAEESSHVMILTDAEGHILWREGSSHVQRDADAVLLQEGTRWSEETIGTNAMGTALASEMPVQIHSAEHLVRAYHAWTCAASPVHDPDTGRLLGTLDISGPLSTMHPALLSLVTTTARLIESQLRLRMAARDDALLTRYARHLALLHDEPAALLNAHGRVVTSQPVAWLSAGERVAVDGSDARVLLPGGSTAVVEPLEDGFLLRAPRPVVSAPSRSRLSMSLLGDGVASATVDGRRHELTLRHAEILALLALYPGGLSSERLALLLRGEQGNPTTVRVEIHRLRNSLGTSVIQTKPYRITAEVSSDVAVVAERLRCGAVGEAVDACGGSLLPRSESPKIRDEREDLAATLRRAVLDSGDAEVLWRFSCTDAGHEDAEVLDALLVVLPGDSPQRATVEARSRRLREEE